MITWVKIIGKKIMVETADLRLPDLIRAIKNDAV